MQGQNELVKKVIERVIVDGTRWGRTTGQQEVSLEDSRNMKKKEIRKIDVKVEEEWRMEVHSKATEDRKDI